MTEPFILSPGSLTLSDLRALYSEERMIALDPHCRGRIEAAAGAVAETLASGKAVYGVNTGFGAMAQTQISPDQVSLLQHRLVLSHSAGTGALLPDAVVRLIMLLKVGALGQGYSGVRLELVDALVALINARVYPCIPSQGSVGASGDLAPLAHMSAVLLGEGDVRIDGEIRPAADGLARAGLAPLTLAAKEGLSLINGTQVSTALALAGLFAIEDVFAAAVVSGAMSIDAALGSDAPFDPRINELRRQPGQLTVAATLRALLDGSQIRASHLDCDRVQDPYSLRCQPQVMGASLDMIGFAAATLAREANGVTDNPLVFVETGELLSGGNFHAEPVAFAADTLAIAVAEIGALAERRIALLIDKDFSTLPPFLIEDGGLNSGFMIPQVTAAALVAENRLLASPASVDSLPTSANQEDHVSMATHGARRLADMAANAATITGIELLAAAQGIDFRRPLETSAPLKRAHAMVREDVDFLTEDRRAAPDIAAAKSIVRSGGLTELVPQLNLPSVGVAA
jgi:histidine ammonia-lyase